MSQTKHIYTPKFIPGLSGAMKSSGLVIMHFGCGRGQKSETSIALTEEETAKLIEFLHTRHTPKTLCEVFTHTT